ncbi:MAG: DUF4382 domain-containing protein [Pseudomonadota bacterium]
MESPHLRCGNPATGLLGLCLLVLSGIVLAGCLMTSKEQRPEDEGGFGQVVVYVGLPAASEAGLAFEATALEVKPAEGEWRRLMTGPLRLDSQAMRGQQVLVAERTLPSGQYSTLRLYLSNASLERKGKALTLALPEGGFVDYPFAFRVERGQTASVLLSWSPDDSLVDGCLLRPAFSRQTATGAARSLEVYVTNEGSNNVSVIDRQAGLVVKTIGVGAAPRGICCGSFESRTKLFVANSGDNTVSVIDPVANLVEQTIPLRFGERPEDIAAYAGGAVYVANYGSQNLSIIDPTFLREVDRVGVGRGPVALAMDPSAEKIMGAVGLPIADLNLWRSYRQSHFYVYVANELSNSVTVVVCRASDGLPEPGSTMELRVEFSPVGLAVDAARAKVYVANRDSTNLSVIDIIQLIRGQQAGAVTSIRNVGNNARSVVPDPLFERLYLLRAAPDEVDFIQTTSSPVIRGGIVSILGAVKVGERPRRLVLDPEAQKLYVTCQGSDSLNVIDKTSRKVLQRIEVGHLPYAVVIIP